MVQHGLAPGSRNGPIRAVLAVSREVRLGTNRRRKCGRGNRLNIILTSPPRLAFLAIRTGDSRWRDKATVAEYFVNTMWDPGCACFAAGTAEDGVTHNPILALDAQIWPLTALHGAAGKFASAMTTAEQRMSVGGGFSYGEDRDGVWTEGTSQMALLMKLLGKTKRAESLIAVIESQRSPDGGFY